MSDWKHHLQDTLALIIGALLFFFLLIIGVYLLSYVIIIAAIIGMVAFIVAQLSGWFGGKRKPRKTDNAGHRVIDHRPDKNKD